MNGLGDHSFLVLVYHRLCGTVTLCRYCFWKRGKPSINTRTSERITVGEYHGAVVDATSVSYRCPSFAESTSSRLQRRNHTTPRYYHIIIETIQTLTLTISWYVTMVDGHSAVSCYLTIAMADSNIREYSTVRVVVLVCTSCYSCMYIIVVNENTVASTTRVSA